MANPTTKANRTAKTAADHAEKAFSSARDRAGDMADAAFSYPTFEVPELVRSFAEQGLNQTREAYARMKSASEEATDLLEDSLATSRESVRDVQFKALDIAKENTDAAFELARQLLNTNSVADAFQLHATFARQRFEAFMDYSKDVQATLSKAGEEASKPAKAIFERTLNIAKAA